MVSEYVHRKTATARLAEYHTTGHQPKRSASKPLHALIPDPHVRSTHPHTRVYVPTRTCVTIAQIAKRSYQLPIDRRNGTIAFVLHHQLNYSPKKDTQSKMLGTAKHLQGTPKDPQATTDKRSKRAPTCNGNITAGCSTNLTNRTQA